MAGAGRLGAVLLITVALLQVAVLVARKVGWATVGAQEAVAVAAVWAVLLSVPWALQERRHVAVDLLASRTSRAVGLWLALLVALALLWFATPYALAAFAAGEGSYESGGIGWRWLAKAALPVFAALLAVQSAASLARRAC